MDTVIETIDLSKVYYSDFRRTTTHALHNVALSVKRGEIFALLGLNGAGKSTLMKIMLDLIRPTSGEIMLFGKPIRSSHWKHKVGYLPELFAAPKFMTAEDILLYLGELGGLKRKELTTRVYDVLRTVDLFDSRNQKINTFSKGMILRLGVAQSLLNQPELLFLDEPTDGLDPSGRKMMRDLIIELANKGITVLLNSHLLSEVELLAHRVGILHKGKVVIQGKLSEIIPQNHHFEVEVSQNPQLGDDWICRPDGSGWKCKIADIEKLQETLTKLQSKSIPVLSVVSSRTSLEEIFFRYISEDSNV
ncbi:MAG TPA: ABC transporter ATP-binding protein [Candidatus Nitrosotenuis sp.]|nr:ABC transporter ATP-binding protein [Candidatus Nitrosotenuis sp.]